MSLHSLTIDKTLKNILVKLESYLDIKFDWAVIDDVFTDAESGSLTFKYYVFYSRSSFFWSEWTIEGAIDEDEPKTIWLQSRGGFGKQKRFEAFFEQELD